MWVLKQIKHGKLKKYHTIITTAIFQRRADEWYYNIFILVSNKLSNANLYILNKKQNKLINGKIWMLDIKNKSSITCARLINNY
jgi:hypothetical protein